MATEHLVGTLTDSAGQVIAVAGDVTVLAAPTISFTGLPVGPVPKGSTVSGKLVGTIDPALTIRSLALAVAGVAVPVAADGSFSFTA
jgi:hypothetical protein